MFWMLSAKRPIHLNLYYFSNVLFIHFHFLLVITND